MRLIFVSDTDLAPGASVEGHEVFKSVATHTSAFRLGDLDTEYAIEGDLVYVINVHCRLPRSFSRKAGVDGQGGITIFRHLLHEFNEQQENLKVVFYSPLDQDRLVALAPENFVLKLAPFVEWKNDGQFAITLKAQIDKWNGQGWPQFNNSSENLLSGWALSNKGNLRKGLHPERLNLKDNKLLVIDDEWKEWALVYSQILNNPPDYYLSQFDDIRGEFRTLNRGEFCHIQKDTLKPYDFVISDLYLSESHETELWKTKELIDKISGFLLLKFIRDIEPAIPVVFHTTSNKFRIFSALAGFGADGQISKNRNCQASDVEKLDTYKAFEELIIDCTKEFGSCWLNECYRYIRDESSLSNKFWRRRSDELKEEIVELIQHAILGYKKLRDSNEEYLSRYFHTSGIDPISVPVGGILTVLGKIQELLSNDNPEFQFLYYLRNQAAHEKNYHLFSSQDAKLALALLFKTLGTSQRSISKGQGFTIPFGSKRQPAKYAHQLFYYLHYYNTWATFIPAELLGIFESRVLFFAEKYYYEHWQHFELTEKNTVNNQSTAIQIDSLISSPFKAEIVNGKFVVKFRD